MQLRHIGPRSHRDLEIDSHHPSATLGDVLSVLGDAPPGDHVWVDGRRVPADALLSGPDLLNGSALSRLPFPTSTPNGHGQADPGSPTGRSGDGAGTTSVDDGRSGRVSKGFGAAGDGPPVRHDRSPVCPATHHGPSRTIPRNRTGRTPPPPKPEPIELPEPMPPKPAVTPVGLVAMVASVAGAGVMVAVLGSWTYAAFALLGPLMMAANALDARFRGRRVARRHAKRTRRELVRLAADLEERSADERAWRAVAFPGAATSLSVGLSEAPRCWERRRTDEDAYGARIGWGTTRWEPPVRGDLCGADDSVRRLLADGAALADAPIGVILEAGEPIAVVGAAGCARGLARSIVIQLATLHGPADLAVAAVVDPEQAPAWDWLAWLPHTVDRDGRRTVATGGASADELVGASAARGEGPTLVVIDDERGLQARRSAARSLLRAGCDPTTGIRCLVVLGPDDAVPASCTVVIHVDRDGTLRGSPDLIAGPARADQVDLGSATDVARRLARFDDPEQDDLDRLLPTEVRLRSLIGLDEDRVDRDHRQSRSAAIGRRAWQGCPEPDPPSAPPPPSRPRIDGPIHRWAHAGDDPAPVAVLGVAADGPVVVDLATDGPHALVVGTTGSGKSEALRSLVLSLAAGQSPDHLVFVLVDFKGGSAFDACAHLPHTVGLVTDLDDHLAARALRCLEAEIRHREERFRACGATDIAELRRRDRTGEPLPRLVVVVDEFATLAASVPDFIDALVDVAQRGRSLGMHLVLATQRPGGAITPAMRANIGLRLALRVQSADESRDVIGTAAAAALPRRAPGRAVLVLGSDEPVTLQLACASLPRASGLPPVTVRPLGLARSDRTHPPEGSEGTGREPTDLTDLTDLVREIAAAWAATDRPAPRRPWPDPLPVTVDWPVVAAGGPLPQVEATSAIGSRRGPAEADGLGGSVPDLLAGEAPGTRTGLTIGLADDPDHQRMVPFQWRPDGGPLLGIGLPGSGTATLAATTVLAAASLWPSAECHIYVIDAVGGGLEALAGLPHVGAVVTSGQIERQRRLVVSLTADLAERRARHHASSVEDGHRLLVVHGATLLQARWEEAGHHELWPGLVDLVAEGFRHGIHVCATVEGAHVPHRLLAACSQRLAFRLGDPADRAALGFPTRPAVDLPFGRALAATGRGDPSLVQIARPAIGLPAAVARLSGSTDRDTPPGAPPPRWIGVLPDVVRPGDLDLRPGGPADCPLAGLDVHHPAHDPPTALGPSQPTARGLDHGPPALQIESGGALDLAVGLADRGLTTATLHLPAGAHAVVSGPPGSGRTTTLEAIARAAARWPSVRLVVVTTSGRGSWPDAAEVVDPGHEVLDDLPSYPGALLVLVDDADRTPDDHRALARLALDRRPDRHVVAAGRNDRFRTGYRHWSREARVDGIGLLLTPDLDLDGDLVGTRLPRRPPVSMVPGRAWMTGRGDGADGFVQVMISEAP